MTKTEIQKETGIPIKVVHKQSPLPYLLAGLAFLLYGILVPISGFFSYLIGAGVLALAFIIGKGIWPGTREEIELPPDTGDSNTNQLLTEARQQLVAIRATDDRIVDAKVSATIRSIDKTCQKILAMLEANTELYSQLRTFLRYYLPTTQKLLESRAAIEQEGMSSENAKVVADRTDRVLPQIQIAFERQLDALEKHKYLDIQVEMDVMEGMLKSDGLTTPKDQ